MKVLCIGIHVDDCEGSVGGTTVLLTRAGAEVLFVNPKPYMHYKGRNKEADRQSMQGAEKLSAKKIILDYNDTKYYRNNEQTVRALADIICDFKPDIVFTMHPTDNHIEHVECAYTGRDALALAEKKGIKPNEIYTYECSAYQTMWYFIPDIFINITDTKDTLISSLSPFSIENADGSWLWREKALRSEYRGLPVNFPLAEVFKVMKAPENGRFLLEELLGDQFRFNGTKEEYIHPEKIFN